MATREEVELQLLQYLHDLKDRELRGQDGMRQALANLTNEVSLLGQKIDANHLLTQERIAGLAARVEKLEKDAEDTGVHVLERAEAEGDRWKAWVLGIAATLIVSLIVGCAGYIAGHR